MIFRDGGVAFPPVDADKTGVRTHNRGDDWAAWRTLEEDVLEDVAYFRALRRAGGDVAKWELVAENVTNEFRRRAPRHGMDFYSSYAFL